MKTKRLDVVLLCAFVLVAIITEFANAQVRNQKVIVRGPAQSSDVCVFKQTSIAPGRLGSGNGCPQSVDGQIAVGWPLYVNGGVSFPMVASQETALALYAKACALISCRTVQSKSLSPLTPEILSGQAYVMDDLTARSHNPNDTTQLRVLSRINCSDCD